LDYRDRWELKDYLRGRTLERRILLFQTGVVVLLLVFALNFWYLQGVHGDDYAELAENNRLRHITRPPTRGVIFDRDQRVLAATRPSLDLVLLRDAVPDPDPQLARLAPILGASQESLLERKAMLENLPRFAPMILTEDVELEQLARIETRRELFPSVAVRESARRNYPDQSLFGHLLGYVGEAGEQELERGAGSLRQGDIVGKTGLELQYDDLLRGVRGWDLVSVNAVGRRIGEAWVDREPEHGQDLWLTVDLDLQRALIDGLAGEVGAGVFLDPWTGEVLALGSTPTFDPSLFADGMSSEDWRQIVEDRNRPLLNRAIASSYAPGSTFKIVMAVAGLEAGLITPETTDFCNGSAEVYGSRRLCWKKSGHGTVNLMDALADSCNVYFYHLGQKIGIDTIHKYGEMFGLGRTTGIDLPGEAPGLLPSSAWKRERYREPWYPGDTISVAIGQGLLATTPLQAATMISLVATEGLVTRPRLVGGSKAEPKRVRIRSSTFELIRAALRRAVTRGTGTEAGLETVAVAGKTGTAQVYSHSAGVNSDDLPKHERDHAWFVGYAPADRPRIAFAVMVEHGGHGGSAAAPVARKVLEVFFAKDSAVESDKRAGATRRGVGGPDASSPAAR
jgi:penicillin-binding protein 2